MNMLLNSDKAVNGVLVKFSLPGHLSPLFRSLPQALPCLPLPITLPFLAGFRGITTGENIEIPHARTYTLVNFRAKPEHQGLLSLWFELVDLS